MLAHELVQPCLGNKANLNQGTSITRGRLHLIPSVRLSGIHFALRNYPTCKSCVLCAYEKNSASKYKKIKTSNFYQKCNAYVIHIVNRKGNRLNNIFAMNVAFSNFYFVFRVFLLTHFILLPDYFQQFLFCQIFSAGQVKTQSSIKNNLCAKGLSNTKEHFKLNS